MLPQEVAITLFNAYKHLAQGNRCPWGWTSYEVEMAASEIKEKFWSVVRENNLESKLVLHEIDWKRDWMPKRISFDA